MSDDDNVVDVTRVMRIGRKIEAEGRDAVDAEDLAYYDRATSLLREWMAKAFNVPEARQQVHALGMQLFEVLPEVLQDRWGDLTPAELGTLALVFPDELPPDARRLVEEGG